MFRYKVLNQWLKCFYKLQQNTFLFDDSTRLSPLILSGQVRAFWYRHLSIRLEELIKMISQAVFCDLQIFSRIFFWTNKLVLVNFVKTLKFFKSSEFLLTFEIWTETWFQKRKDLKPRVGKFTLSFSLLSGKCPYLFSRNWIKRISIKTENYNFNFF